MVFPLVKVEPKLNVVYDSNLGKITRATKSSDVPPAANHINVRIGILSSLRK